jgi:ABC-2 type transport system permease protein
MNATRAMVRNELRLLGGDPVPAIVLVAMPLVLMAILTPALKIALSAQGYDKTSGAEQTAPGMISVFAFFAAALVGYSLFREHGWRTWPRLRAAGVTTGAVLVGKLTVPAGLLALQQVALFSFGIYALDMTMAGSWTAIVACCIGLNAVVLTAGLAAAAAFDTVAQVSAFTNLGAMVLGGLGGGFVPVEGLPKWMQPFAPISPSYWAMRGFRSSILDGEGLAGVLGSVGVLLAIAAVLATIAALFLRLDNPKRTWS